MLSRNANPTQEQWDADDRHHQASGKEAASIFARKDGADAELRDRSDEADAEAHQHRAGLPSDARVARDQIQLVGAVPIADQRQ